MTVAELIAELQKYPPNLLVAYECYSEYCLLEASELTIGEACLPRPDGWVHSKRPDKPSREYLLLPGN